MPHSAINNDEISDGVNLLISILIRHPEIATINFIPQNKSLKLKFMLSAIPTTSEFSDLQQLLNASMSAYHMLEGLSIDIAEFELYPHDQVAILSLIRDIKTISNNEISLLTALLREHLQKILIIDPNDSLNEEDTLRQEEVMEDMLENIKYHTRIHPLIGIRENGRILIFNK